MKYSITQWILGGEPLETTLQRLQKYGYDGMELTPDPEAFEDTKAVRSLFRKYGLEPSMMDLTPFHDLSHPDRAKRAEAIELNKHLLGVCKEIGCRRMLVCGSEVGRIRAISNYDEEWALGVESTRLLADSAAQHGVQIVMEVINHYETCVYYNVDRALRFLADVDHGNVAIMVDTYHMNIAENGMCRAIHRVADKLANFHISDSNRCGVGHGHIDFLEVMRALKIVGYDGYIGLEPQAPGPDPFTAVKANDSVATVDTYLRESINILRTVEDAGDGHSP